MGAPDCLNLGAGLTSYATVFTAKNPDLLTFRLDSRLHLSNASASSSGYKFSILIGEVSFELTER
jgi:hypothetical protein